VSVFLLDTHTLIWWLDGGTRLSARARRAIEDRNSRVMVSAATAWEIAIKHHAGKLSAPQLVSNFTRELDAEGFQELPINSRHAVLAGGLKGLHRDPFDRMLAAQAQLEKLPIISRDGVFDHFAVQRLW